MLFFQRLFLLASTIEWFSGWPVHQLYNAQPSNDGISNQDCVEIRQSFGQPSHSAALAGGFYWNDRDCSVSNPFVCQKPRNDGRSFSTILFVCVPRNWLPNQS